MAGRLRRFMFIPIGVGIGIGIASHPAIAEILIGKPINENLLDRLARLWRDLQNQPDFITLRFPIRAKVLVYSLYDWEK